MHTAKSLLLSPNWDMQVADDGSLKLCRGGLAVAQNCANEIRLWTNDAYFQRDNGIPWLEAQLAKKLDEAVLKSVIREACMRVPDVASVQKIEVTEFDEENRTLHGEIEIVTTGGEVGRTSF